MHRLLLLSFVLTSTAAAQHSGTWDDRFGYPILDGSVRTFLVEDDGLLVGGDFRSAGGVDRLDGIARFDGKSWHPVAPLAVRSPYGNAVYDIVRTDAGLYVGGTFEIDGGGIGWFALWDGMQWRRPGSGITCSYNCMVAALAVDGDDVYLGGSFTNAGGHAEVDRLARFDGAEYHAVGDGMNGDIAALLVHDGDLYVGGDFTNAGGVANADRIARWDGASWHALGIGFSDGVADLLIHDGALYAAGMFLNAGGHPHGDYVARWDGAGWQPVGPGITDDVLDLAVHDGTLYAASRGGTFRFDGTRWELLNGRSHSAQALASYDGELYVGTRSIDLGIMKRSGNQWSWITDGLIVGSNGLAAFDVFIDGNDTYVAGFVGDLGADPEADFLGRYDGSRWYRVGERLPGAALAVHTYGGDVIAGGLFENAGGLSFADYIARWDGQAWQNLGAGLNGGVAHLDVLGGELYVAGAFTDAGGVTDADFLARWDGSAWSAVAPGLTGNVLTFTPTATGWYVGGLFTDAGGRPDADYLARWDGGEWHGLGGGLNGAVRAIAVDGERLYAGGSFYDAGGDPRADRIAVWDGATWEAVGDGLNGSVYDLAVVHGVLVAVGIFTDAGGDPQADGIAYWDGQTWRAVGGGLYTKVGSRLVDNASVYRVVDHDGSLYVAGNFTNAGDGSQVAGIGIFDGTLVHTGIEEPPMPSAGALQIFPNPVRDRAEIILATHATERVRISIYDLLGREVGVIYDGLSNRAPTTWSTAHLSSGLYVIRVLGETVHASRTVTVVR